MQPLTFFFRGAQAFSKEIFDPELVSISPMEKLSAPSDTKSAEGLHFLEVAESSPKFEDITVESILEQRPGLNDLSSFFQIRYTDKCLTIFSKAIKLLSPNIKTIDEKIVPFWKARRVEMIISAVAFAAATGGVAALATAFSPLATVYAVSAAAGVTLGFFATLISAFRIKEANDQIAIWSRSRNLPNEVTRLRFDYLHTKWEPQLIAEGLIRERSERPLVPLGSCFTALELQCLWEINLGEVKDYLNGVSDSGEKLKYIHYLATFSPLHENIREVCLKKGINSPELQLNIQSFDNFVEMYRFVQNASTMDRKQINTIADQARNRAKQLWQPLLTRLSNLQKKNAAGLASKNREDQQKDDNDTLRQLNVSIFQHLQGYIHSLEESYNQQLYSWKNGLLGQLKKSWGDQLLQAWDSLKQVHLAALQNVKNPYDSDDSENEGKRDAASEEAVNFFDVIQMKEGDPKPQAPVFDGQSLEKAALIDKLADSNNFDEGNSRHREIRKSYQALIEGFEKESQ
jgi:hypothetical protein